MERNVAAAGYEKLAQVALDVQKVVRTIFHIDGHGPVDAVLIDSPEGMTDPDFVVGIVNTQDEEGMVKRQYAKLPARLKESREAVVEFYDDHEALVKGVGAVATIVGAVVVGSLVVRRQKKR